MLIFKRSVSNEILSHIGVVFSALIMIWFGVLITRLQTEASGGYIGVDLVLGMSIFSAITALPIILLVSVFIAVITTVSRAYREQEMYVWLSSGVSLLDWIKPVLTVVVPIALLVSVLSVFTVPWAYLQIESYKVKFENRSDLSRIVDGKFIEINNGNRVFFIEPASKDNKHAFGKIFAREINKDWVSIFNVEYGDFTSNKETGERFIELGSGTRYDVHQGTPEFRVSKFDSIVMNIYRNGESSEDVINKNLRNFIKMRSITKLFEDHKANSNSQILWRLSPPIAVIILSLLAIPLGSVNPRFGKSWNVVVAIFVGLLYLNLLNIMRGLVASGKINLMPAIIILNCLFLLITIICFWAKLRIKRPKKLAGTDVLRD